MLTSITQVNAKIRAGAPGKWAVGDGVYLQVAKTGDRPATGSWLFRFQRPGRQSTWMGLGPVAHVTLGEARAKGLEARKLRYDGIDPLHHKREQFDRRLIEARSRVTFRDAVADYIAEYGPGWKNAKHRNQWQTTLASLLPQLGDLRADAITDELIEGVVRPIMQRTPETGRRTRQRVRMVIQWLKQNRPTLSARSRTVKHHAAAPWQHLPAFMTRLRDIDSTSAKALEFTILTAARTGEVTGARWDEIDLDAKLWVIPAERMKMGREHRVPLAARALEILAALPREDDNPYLFIGARAGRGLSTMAMLHCLKGLDEGLTTHGFRSSFRDWASETTHFPPEVSEKALAHAVKDKTEKAYRRGDLLEKRRALMADWSRYCGSPPAGAAVLPITRKQA